MEESECVDEWCESRDGQMLFFNTKVGGTLVAVILKYGQVPPSGERHVEGGILFLTRYEATAGRSSP